MMIRPDTIHDLRLVKLGLHVEAKVRATLGVFPATSALVRIAWVMTIMLLRTNANGGNIG